jgi:hypothetical protein
MCSPEKRIFEAARLHKMKQCPTCQEEFLDKFAFCPVDGTSLDPVSAPAPAGVEASISPAEINASYMAASEIADENPSEFENIPAYESSNGNSHSNEHVYSLTMLEDKGLTRRLLDVMRDVAKESQLTWPEFKRSPLRFTGRLIQGYSLALWKFLAKPNVAFATLAAIFLVSSLIVAVVALDRYRAAHPTASEQALQDVELLTQITDIPDTQPTPDPGPAGTNKGKGGGSKPKFERPAGGGGGGRQEQAPASKGKLPQASLDIPQVLAPEVKPPPIKNPSLPVAATIKADPLLFPPDTRPIPYGDPKSKSTMPSAGPGTGGGIGSGTGAVWDRELEEV